MVMVVVAVACLFGDGNGIWLLMVILVVFSVFLAF